MKILLLLGMVIGLSFLQGSDSFGMVPSIPEVDLNDTYKISFDSGNVDWNPVSNTLVMTDNDTLISFAANGSQLAPIYKANFTVDMPRFNHDGSKIEFVIVNSEGRPVNLDVLDLSTKHLHQLIHGITIGWVSWTPDDKIIYSRLFPSASSQVLELDIKNNLTSTLIGSVYNLHGLDVSPDGKRLVVSENYSNNCSHSGEPGAGCFDHLFVYDLESKKEVAEVAKTDTYKWDPRWSPDESYIIYGSGDCQVNAVTLDDSNDRPLVYRANKDPACIGSARINKDQTMIAFFKGYGGVEYNGKFNPLNKGLYLAHTNKCLRSNCIAVSRSIPLLPPIQTSRDLYLGPGRSVELYYDSGDSTEKQVTYGLDNKTLSFVLENQGKPRSIILFFPTQDLNGNVTVLINGKQSYPASNNCGTALLFFTKKCQQTASEENFGEWTQVNASDNDTSTSLSTFNIVGTNVIPEFPFAVPVLLIGVVSLIVFYRIRFWLG
ncbi:MAG: hypothetical protein KGI27_10975 [Thaumarchaeota archaeon]|nr:hypothetical protein [Nitrososphaerota archaeon]